MADKFNVLDMANEYAADNDIDTEALFHPDTTATNESVAEETKTEVQPVKQGEWRPDDSLVNDMNEFKQSAVYDKEDLVEKDEGLKNILDDTAEQAKLDQLNEMQRQESNIEAFKKRHNIFRLHIPQGEWQVKMLTAASDPNYKEAQDALDAVFNVMITQLPPEVVEYNKSEEVVDTTNETNTETTDSAPVITNPTIDNTVPTPTEVTTAVNDLKVVIDKRQANQVVWSPEDIDKIRKSRKIELNIVDAGTIDFGTITDASNDEVSNILDQYTRTTNDVSSPLPASQYRATFTGLTYPEIIGLQSSIEMNPTDAERKKWTIAFNHMKNVSIGPWEEYTSYIDADNHLVKVPYKSPVPVAYQSTVRHVSKFEDFMRKTSYMDLDFIIWKILCATTTSKEIVSITCGNNINGKKCNHTYDWIYNPSDLLDPAEMDPTVLENMSQVADAGDLETALKLYNESPVCGNNIVTLKESGWSVVYGHASAWDYVEGGIYDAIRKITSKSDDEVKTDDVEDLILYGYLNCVKSILVPKPDRSGYVRISGPDNLVKAIRKLGTVDFQTIGTIVNMMVQGYTFPFKIKGALCPKCKGMSTIPIDKMDTMLFMIARSLDSTTVSLTKQ